MAYKVAVVGATGTVGRSMLNLLASRNFPCSTVAALSSKESEGQEVSFGEDEILEVQALEGFSFEGVDLVLSSVSSGLTRRFALKAAAEGAIVVDNSSAFRRQEDVPLVVPEINGHLLDQENESGIVASPNCVAIPLALSLAPLKELGTIRRVVVSTYQSVSGAGRAAMDELFSQTRKVFHHDVKESKNFSRQIAFNVIPFIGDLEKDGVTDEEDKIVYETQDLLGLKMEMAVTAVRVPVFVGHGAAVNVVFEEDVTVKQAEAILKDAPGVELVKGAENFVTPYECVGDEITYISRLRPDTSTSKGLNFWITCDNLRKGAALNAVQIAEHLFS
ncbi:MAG: aspartate-semialdehyde dehydrogenase [bacterium]|nr:aspartate-semialdehyde dehydrogenase [bacterium]